MGKFEKAILLTLAAAVIITCGCDGGYYYDDENTQTQRIIIKHEDSWSDILRANTEAWDSMAWNTRENAESFNDSMDRTMDRMRDTMGRFGRTVDSANRMRRSR